MNLKCQISKLKVQMKFKWQMIRVIKKEEIFEIEPF